MKYLFIYVIIINFITFITYGLDKYFAIKKMWRVSEFTLYMLSLSGGFLGSLAGMKVFHHKTKKIMFYLINILAIILWIGGLYGFRGLFT